MNRWALMGALIGGTAAGGAFMPTAQAQTATIDLGVDQITLKGGATIRGTLVEEVPGEKVTLMVVGEQAPRTIPWEDIAEVERGKFSSSAPAASVASNGPSDASSESPGVTGPGIVKLHIETDEPMTLFRVAGGAVSNVGEYTAVSTFYESVCASPCDRLVDGSRGEEFVVLGDGVTNSEPFSLTGWSGEATLDVDPGSAPLSAAGVWFSATGITAVLVGGILLGVGLAVDSPSDDAAPLATIGGVSMGGGGVLLAAGIPMMIGGATHYELRRPSAPKSSAGATRGPGVRPERVAAKWYLGQF